LAQLPALPPSANGITRTATLTLDESGTLRGDVREVRQGDRAAEQRFAVRSAKADTDRIRPIETLLSTSLSVSSPNFILARRHPHHSGPARND
jgi:hypothetical protein